MPSFRGDQLDETVSGQRAGRADRGGVGLDEYERLVEAYEELEDQRIHDEAVDELRAGAKSKPLEEVAAEIERETAGEERGS